MALVVFLKGVNVGGYRRFRPSELAQQLERYDVINVGAAGTLVIRKPVSQSKIRPELERRLPFAADVMICNGRDILRLTAQNPFAKERPDRNIVQFVSVLQKRPRLTRAVPFNVPTSGEWGLRVLGVQDRFVYGVYRRQMKAIGYLGQLDKIFGVTATTRSWSTIQSIARLLSDH